MKQLYLFNAPPSSSQTHESSTHTWLLFVDGASRNNPGPSGAGVYILKDSVPVYKEGFYLGIKTNNQAEYLALLLGIFILDQRVQQDDTIRIISDSELLVRQLTGKYRVKRTHLKPLHALATKKISVLNAELVHVVRAENVEADKMANRGIDYKKAVSKDFITLLNNHEISL